MLTRSVLGHVIAFRGPGELVDGARVRYAEGDARHARLEVELSAAADLAWPGPERRIEVTGSDLRGCGGGVEMVADAEAGSARARVHPAALADVEAFGAEVLDTLVLFLTTARDRVPVHAAAVERAGGALLLSGPSGTGKSTLAYAALSAGVPVLADEAVYLESNGAVRVWTRGRTIALPPDARERFPELAGRRVARRPDGRSKVLVPLPRTGSFRPVSDETRPPAGLCLIRRGGSAGAGNVVRLDASQAVEEVVRDLEPGFDRFADVVAAPLMDVARAGAWRLDLPADPRAALALLAALR